MTTFIILGSMCQPNAMGLYSSDPTHQGTTRGSTVSSVSSVSKPGSTFVGQVVVPEIITSSTPATAKSKKEEVNGINHTVQVSIY